MGADLRGERLLGLERVGLMSELVVPSREELLARLDDHTQRARLGWAPEEAAA